MKQPGGTTRRSEFHERSSLRQRCGEGLVDDDMFACIEGCRGDLKVGPVRRCNHNKIDIIPGKPDLEVLFHNYLRELLPDAILVAGYHCGQLQA